MRVVLFDTVLSGHHLGYVASLTRFLHSEGDEVTFATWGADPRLTHLTGEERPDRVAFVGRGPVAARLRAVPAGTAALRRVLVLAERERADVVHVLDSQRFEVPLAFSPRRRSAPPVVATMIAPPPISSPGVRRSVPRRAFHRARWWGLRRALATGRLDALLALTAGHRELVAGFLGEGLTERVLVTGYPIPPVARIGRAEARRELDLPADRPIVLMVGGMRADQGPELLLRSLGHLPGDWRAVLAGVANPRRRAHLEALRSELPEPERVIAHLDWVPARDVSLYLAAADVVALPYRRMPGRLSAVLDQAAAGGRPVVATDVGELGSIVREHGLGAVVEPDDPRALAEGIARLLEDPRVPDPAKAARYADGNHWRSVGRRVRAAYAGEEPRGSASAAS